MHYEKINIFRMRDYIFSEWELPDEFLYKIFQIKTNAIPKLRLQLTTNRLRLFPKHF